MRFITKLCAYTDENCGDQIKSKSKPVNHMKRFINSEQCLTQLIGFIIKS